MNTFIPTPWIKMNLYKKPYVLNPILLGNIDELYR